MASPVIITLDNVIEINIRPLSTGTAYLIHQDPQDGLWRVFWHPLGRTPLKPPSRRPPYLLPTPENYSPPMLGLTGRGPFDTEHTLRVWFTYQLLAHAS